MEADDWVLFGYTKNYLMEVVVVWTTHLAVLALVLTKAIEFALAPADDDVADKLLVVNNADKIEGLAHER